jgi:hypothetical protein
MKATLSRVGLNELLGSPLDVSIQRSHRFLLLRDIQFNCFVNAKRPNARIKLPDINTESHPSDHDNDASPGQLE